MTVPARPRAADARDLTDPLTHLRADAAEYWRGRRRRTPIFWHEGPNDGPGFWVVCTHDAARAVYRDVERFSSERGNVLLTLSAGHDSAAGTMLAVTDQPRHTELRRLLRPALTVGSVRRLAARVRDRTRELVTGRVGTGTFDFAREIASRIPIWTVCDLLGVPQRDHDLLVTLSKQALSSNDPEQVELTSAAARQEILLCFLDHVRYQRRNPADGLIAALLGATLEGRSLTDRQIVMNLYSLLLGGDETVRLTMINAVHRLARDGVLWQQLRGVADLPAAVEEIIRCFAPTLHFGRTARTDVTILGAEVRTGEIVTVWNASANRDEDAFPDPDSVLLHRDPNPHLSFGYGTHYCLGAALARTEIGAVLDELRKSAAAIIPTGPAAPLYSNILSGYATLPVELIAP